MTEEIEKPDPILESLKAEFECQRQIETASDGRWIVEWMLRKKGELDMMEAAVNQRHEEILKQIESRRKNLDFCYGDTFRQESQKMLEANTKGKSIKLHTGTIGYRTSPEKIEVTDQHQVDMWAISNMEIDKLREHAKLDIKLIKDELPGSLIAKAFVGISKTALKDHFKATGELPDGCELVEAHDEFYAKPVQLQLKGESDGPAND